MRKRLANQRGMTFITAVFTLILFSILASAFASLIKRQAVSSSYFMTDEQIFFMADSGVEMGINWLYQDDATKFQWWDNGDPADRTKLLPRYSSISLGGGTVDVSTQYAATTSTSDVALADTMIIVNSTADFPSSGVILINTELIQYFSKTATQFIGCIRGYGVTSPDTHLSGSFVYPSSMLSGNITAADTTITVSSTDKFLPGGTVFIENEAIKYRSKDSTHFYNCQRGSFGTTAQAHVQNLNVLPASYEVYISSTAKKDGRQKTVEALLQYQYGTKWE
jgi:hypothetical protein